MVYFLCGIEVVFRDMFFLKPHVCEATLNAKVFGSLTGRGDTVLAVRLLICNELTGGTGVAVDLSKWGKVGGSEY